MKTKKRLILTTLSLLLIFSLGFAAVASARNSPLASAGSDPDIDRGVAWEMLNETTYRMDDLINDVGDDFSDNYRAALKRYQNHAKDLLDSAASTTNQLTEMTDDMNDLIGEQNNPANHARFGYYTVAFTNDGSWSDPIYLYNWSDDGGEISAWPGEAMLGGYTNEYGQKQYYAFVPMDVPNIVISSPQLNAANANVPCVEVQTVDLFVFANTGYYLTGAREGAKYKVATWELKDPIYKTFDEPEPTEPPTQKPTEKPTEPPTQPPTAKPTEPPTEKPTVIDEPVTEPSTEFNIDDYIPNDGTMLDFYEQPAENQEQKSLRQLIVTATNMLAPGNSYAPKYIEKISRIRNFAVKVYNDARAADHELIGAGKMLQAAFEEKSYQEIVDIMRQWFIMPESPDPTTPTTDDPSETKWDALSNHLIGDADDDGSITVMDATRIQRVLVGLESQHRAKAQRYAAFTGDLNILDATCIQRYLAGYDTAYAIGQHFSSSY